MTLRFQRSNSRPVRRSVSDFRLPLWLTLASSVALAGCKPPAQSIAWHPSVPSPQAHTAGPDGEFPFPPSWQSDAGANAITSVSVSGLQDTAERAALAERRSDAECVDLYALVALQSWAHLAGPSNSASGGQAVWELYHQSVEQLISAAQQHQRLDPQRGLVVRFPGAGTGHIRVVYHGFAWRPEDFNELRLARNHRSTKLARHWYHPGLGVPLVAIRRRPRKERFHAEAIPFAATAILRPDAGSSRRAAGDTTASPGLESGSAVGVLELYDPLRVNTVSVGARSYDLARDISAPLALARNEIDRDNFQDFLRPGGNDAEAELRMIEPYQPTKIPLVLVHGLLSDKFTWTQLVNDLRSVPWINERFQIWAFQYPTGQPFLRSAAEMRRELREAMAVFDPHRRDPAASQTVLVGHSMGGLVSKLQVTSSGTVIWDELANRPFGEIRAEPQQRKELAELFFFEPLPFVERVVFIGTPHQGSPWADSLLGRFGSQLVKAPREREELLQSLMQNNPDLFSSELRDGIPTSVDLLKPESTLLDAMCRLPVRPGVRLHTIAGTSVPFVDGTSGDGVVAVTSARHPGAVSERFVSAKHTELTEDPDTGAELTRILALHLREYDSRLNLSDASLE